MILIPFGKLIKPHGLNGFISCRFFNNDSRLLKKNIKIYFNNDINNFLNIDPLNMFFAKADGYPDYIRTLESQFDVDQPEIQLLRERYNLDDSRYFQTGLMYFDTSIIQTDTLNQLIDLAHKYPICITNEQGILNLFFQDNNSLYNEYE